MIKPLEGSLAYLVTFLCQVKMRRVEREGAEEQREIQAVILDLIT